MNEFGHRLYLTGVSLETSEEDLRALLFKYTHHEPDLVERVDLETTHPTYIISFQLLEDGLIQQFASRVNGLYWHGHSIVAHVI